MTSTVAAATAEITDVLQRHGFRPVSEFTVRQLVQEHVDRFIEEMLGNRDELRRAAAKLDDLGEIRAVLCGYVPAVNRFGSVAGSEGLAGQDVAFERDP